MSRYIDAEKLYTDVMDSWKNNPHREARIAHNHNMEHQHFLSIIDRALTADVAPVKHGAWKPYKTPLDTRQIGWICNCCSSVNRDLSNGDTDYCPHCGAKMDEDEEADNG